MKPPPVAYEAPTSLAEAVSLLGDTDREVVILAGGQSLMPMLNLRLARPDLLVDLGRIEGLDDIRLDGDRLVLGAMATKRAVETSELVRRHHPLLHAATVLVGHPQIRNRGTVGGSMAHADPAAEYPAVALLADAEMKVVGGGGERTIGADEFFVSYLTTALEPGEVLVEVSFPLLASGIGWSFDEVARRHGDFAMVGAGVTVGVDGAGRCERARIVLFGVGPRPIRMHAAEGIVNGEAPGDDLFARAGAAVRAAVDEPMSDIHASAEYRRQLADVLTVRGLAEAVARATGAA